MPISLASSTSTMSNNAPIAANFNKNGPTLVEYSSNGGGGNGSSGITPTFITTSSPDHSNLFSSPTYLINSKLVNTTAPTASFIQIVNSNNKIESAQQAHHHHHHQHHQQQQQQQTSLIAPNKLFINNNGTGATFNSNGVVTNDSNSTNRPVLFVLLTPNDLNNLTKQSEANIQQQPAIYDTNNNIISNQKAGQIVVTSNNQTSSVNDNIDSAIDAVLAKFRCDDSLEDESTKKSRKTGASSQQTVKLEKNGAAANNNNNNSSSLTVAAQNEQAGLNKASVSSNKARTSYISSLIANREQKRAEGGADELNQSEHSNTGTTVTTSTITNNSVAKKPASQNILTILASNGTGGGQQISSSITESTNNLITTSPKVNTNTNNNNNGFQSIKPKKSTTSSIQKINTSDMTNSISYLECNNLKRILSEPVASSVEKSNDSNGVISVTMTQALMESSFGQNVLIKVAPLQENKKTVKRGGGGRKKQATVNDGPKRKNARQPRKSSSNMTSIPTAGHAVDLSGLEINSLPNSLVITTASTNGRVMQHDQTSTILAQSKPKKLKTVADLVKQNNQQKQQQQQQQQLLATTAANSSSSNLIPSIEFNDNRVLTSNAMTTSNSSSNNSTLCLSNDQSSSHDHHLGINCWINGSNNHDKNNNNNGLLNNEHSGFVRLVENDLVSSSKLNSNNLSITSIPTSSTLSIPLSSSATGANNTHHLDSSMHHHISHHQIQSTSSTPANTSSNTTTLTINDIDNLLELELQPVVDSSSGGDKYLDLDDIDVNPLVDCYNSTPSSSTMNHHHNNNNNNHSRNLTHLTSTTSNNKSVGNHLDEFNFQISVCSSASSSSSSSSSSGFSEPSTCSNLSTCSSQGSNTSSNGMLPGFKLTNNSSASSSSSSSSSPSWNTNQLEFNCYENKQNGSIFLQNLVDSSHHQHHHHMMSNNCNQQNLYANSMDLGYSNSMIESSLFGNGTGFNFFNDEIKLEIQ